MVSCIGIGARRFGVPSSFRNQLTHRKDRKMKEEEITVDSIEELVKLIDEVPEGTILEIDLGEEDENGG